MYQQNDIHNIQNMLGILMQTPNPNQLLKNSKPLDREEKSIEIIQQGSIQKYKWQGAIPGKMRDQKLQLNYDKQMNKVKNSLQASSQQKYPHCIQNSFSNRNESNILRYSNNLQNQSFSVESRQKDFTNSQTNNEENFMFFNKNQNQSAIIQNNYFDNILTPHSSSNRKYISQTTTVPVISFHNLSSPKNIRVYNHNRIQNYRSKENQQQQLQQQDPKQLSIKYIGVHNDMIGVLSRKIPMEQQISKMSKSRQIQEERRVKSGVGIRNKWNLIDYSNSVDQMESIDQSNYVDQQNKSLILEQKSANEKNQNSTIFDNNHNNSERQEQNQIINNHESREDDITNLQKYQGQLTNENKNKQQNANEQLDEIQYSPLQIQNEQDQFDLIKQQHMEKQDIKRYHQNQLRQVLEEQGSQIQIQKSFMNGQNMNFYQNPNEIKSYQTQNSTKYQRFYGNSLSKAENEILSNQTNTLSTRPNSTSYQRAKQQQKRQHTPSSTSTLRSHSLNQNKRILKHKQYQSQNSNDIDANYSQNNYFTLQQQGIQNINHNQSSQLTYDMPEPEKYDKFIITKYSLERKLTTLKKSRDQNPSFSKKQFYAIMNNQLLNTLNNY